MKISTGIEIEGKRLFILYEDKVSFRLATTCFRGIRSKFAGNFFQWGSFEDFVNDKCFDFVGELSLSVERTYKEYLTQEKKTRVGVVTLDFEQMVGWESTDDQENYNVDVLEEFHPNRRCTALRIRPEFTYIEAPKTSLMTVVYGICIENHNIVASILTIYPGEYVGPLHCTEGGDTVDITKRQGRVFFDWNHPGE